MKSLFVILSIGLLSVLAQAERVELDSIFHEPTINATNSRLTISINNTFQLSTFVSDLA